MKTTKIIILIIGIAVCGTQMDCDAKIKVKFAFGDRAAINDCAGRGICAYINFRVINENFNPKDLDDNMGIAEIEIIDDKMIFDITFDNSGGRNEPEFSVAQEIILDADICEKLGYQSIEIQPSEYLLDYSKSVYGTVKLSVVVR